MAYDIVRTGQAHRTLPGHTGPITCLQFDEVHLASGSQDKTIRVSRVLWVGYVKKDEANAEI